MIRNTIILYIFLVFVKNVYLSPISVHEESKIVNDQAQNKNLNSVTVNSQSANSGEQSTAGFHQENENKHVGAQDSGSYNKVDNNKNVNQNSGQFFDENSHRQNAGSAFNAGQQGGHRKGHHKSGFKNSHHKEESENNYSYYDDSNDEGGHFVYDSRNGGFSSAGSDKNQGSHLDSHLYSKDNGQRGSYNVGGNYDKTRGDTNGYNQQKYYNNYNDYNKNNAQNERGQQGQYINNYYQRPQHNVNYEPRRTITIYEDPREFYYSQNNNRYDNYPPRYDSGLIQLNFKQNPYLHYPNAFNDYYY